MTGKRGGKRAGAGRKSLMPYEDRHAIGAAVRNRLVRRTNAEPLRKIEALDDEGRLRRLWATLHDVPPRKRRKVDPDALADRLEEIRLEIGDKPSDRFFPGAANVKKGIRGPIIKSLARALSRKTKTNVRPSFVLDCYEEFRREKARMDAEPYDEV